MSDLIWAIIMKRKGGGGYPRYNGSYSTRHIRRLLKNGLEKLQEKYNDVDISDIEQEDQNGNTERF